jgi:SAM-dependent methyltransferase
LKRHISKLCRLCNDVGSVLDCGCGAGFNLRELRASFPQAQLYGSDLTDGILSHAATTCRDLDVSEFFALNVETGHLPREFDLILMNQVLEHIDNDVAALRNIYAMTKKYLLITVPGGSFNETSKLNGHFRHYSKKELADKVSATGFRIISCYEFGWPMHSLYKWALNLFPAEAQKKMGYGAYGPLKKFLSYSLTLAFYANVMPYGENVVLLAERPRT